MAQWLDGASDLRSTQVRLSLAGISGSYPGQVVHTRTRVPLSPGRITPYRPNGDDALRLGRFGVELVSE